MHVKNENVEFVLRVLLFSTIFLFIYSLTSIFLVQDFIFVEQLEFLD